MVHSQLTKMKKGCKFLLPKKFFLTKYSFFLINGCSSWLMKSGIHQKCQLPSLSIISIFNFALLIYSQKHQPHHHINFPYLGIRDLISNQDINYYVGFYYHLRHQPHHHSSPLLLFLQLRQNAIFFSSLQRREMIGGLQLHTAQTLIISHPGIPFRSHVIPKTKQFFYPLEVRSLPFHSLDRSVILSTLV